MSAEFQGLEASEVPLKYGIGGVSVTDAKDTFSRQPALLGSER